MLTSVYYDVLWCIMMNVDTVVVIVDDAVGIFYMINPVMVRKRLGRVNVRAGDVAAGIVNQHKLSLHKCLQVLGGLMMPAATSRSVMSIDPAKALSHHDRVNHIEDAAGIVASQCCLLKGGDVRRTSIMRNHVRRNLQRRAWNNGHTTVASVGR